MAKKNEKTPQASTGPTSPATTPPAGPAVQTQSPTAAAVALPPTNPQSAAPPVPPPAVTAHAPQQVPGQPPATATAAPPSPPAPPVPAPAPGDGPPLDELARLIKAKHQIIVGLGRTTLEQAREAGAWLNQAYLKVTGEGLYRWDSWVTKFCGVHPRTANNYMRIAANWEQVEAAVATGEFDWADLTVADVLELLKTGTRASKKRDADTKTAGEEQKHEQGKDEQKEQTQPQGEQQEQHAAEDEGDDEEAGGQQEQPAGEAKKVAVAPAKPVTERLSPRPREEVEEMCRRYGVSLKKFLAVLAGLGVELQLLDEGANLQVA